MELLVYPAIFYFWKVRGLREYSEFNREERESAKAP
jgi:hypothetical protein